MPFDLSEALAYYKKQGAPADQTALISLLREVQQASGGSIPQNLLPAIAAALGTKESYLLAVVRRIPSLRLSDTHLLELCAGKNCGKNAALLEAAERFLLSHPGAFTLKQVPCLRQCGRGPNLRWDGTLYSRADEALLDILLNGILK